MTTTAEEFNEKAEAFHRATGIWPPGRDRPSACNTEDVEDLRLSAWLYWNKVADELSRLQHAVREAYDVLSEPGMMDLDEWKAWRKHTTAMCYQLLVETEQPWRPYGHSPGHCVRKAIQGSPDYD